MKKKHKARGKNKKNKKSAETARPTTSLATLTKLKQQAGSAICGALTKFKQQAGSAICGALLTATALIVAATIPQLAKLLERQSLSIGTAVLMKAQKKTEVAVALSWRADWVAELEKALLTKEMPEQKRQETLKVIESYKKASRLATASLEAHHPEVVDSIKRGDPASQQGHECEINNRLSDEGLVFTRLEVLNSGEIIVTWREGEQEVNRSFPISRPIKYLLEPLTGEARRKEIEFFERIQDLSEEERIAAWREYLDLPPKRVNLPDQSFEFQAGLPPR